MHYPKPRINKLTKILLACGVIGPVFFVMLFSILGAAKAGYDPLRHPISSLSIGENGWMQQGNFIVTGLLFIAFSLGLSRAFPISKWGPRLIALVGIGLIGAGICTTDPVYGFPPDLPLALAQFTLRGHLHDFFSLFVFACLPAACFVYRKKFLDLGEEVWAKYSAFTAIAMIVAFLLAGIGFKQVPVLVDMAGIFQRLSIIVGWTWIAMLALYLPYNKSLTGPLLVDEQPVHITPLPALSRFE